MDKTTRSYLIYFGTVLICFFLANKAEKRNNKRILFFIALLLSLVSGLRKWTVGIDTQNYYWTFNSIQDLSSCFEYNDPLFYVYSYLLMKINNDAYFPIMVWSIVSNYLVIYRLWDFKNISSYKYSVLRYITIFFLFSFNCMRQFVSIAIVFYATSYVEKGNYKKFLFFVLIASTFHISSLLAAIYVLLEAFNWKKLTRKQKNYISASVLLLPLYALITYYSASGRYERYLMGITMSSFNSLLIKFILLIVVIMFYYSSKKFFADNNRRLIQIFLFYAIGLIGNAFGTFYRFMERTGYYFYIYATVYTGVAANYKRYAWLFRIIILIIILRAFMTNIQTNSMGQMPYLFNWE